MKPSAVYEILLVILGIIEKRCCYISDQQNAVTLQHNMVTCSRNMACKYLICMWERNPTVNSDKCVLLGNHCSCPSNKICAMTDHVTHGSAILSFQYRCKDPAFLFDNRVERTTAATKESLSDNSIPFGKRK